MAKFKRTLSLGDGKQAEVNATTCGICNGVGYITKPVKLASSFAPDWDRKEAHTYKSGDPCPVCLGRGWVVTTDEMR
jgi:hypothetical protein